jgi:hypothetical protein
MLNLTNKHLLPVFVILALLVLAAWRGRAYGPGPVHIHTGAAV